MCVIADNLICCIVISSEMGGRTDDEFYDLRSQHTLYVALNSL